MTKKSYTKGLATKFYLLVIPLVICTAVAVTLFVVRQKQNESSKKLLDKGILTANFIADLSEFGVYSEDKFILTEIIAKVKDPEVAYISVLDKNRSILSEYLLRILLNIVVPVL